MARAKIRLADNIARVIFIDPEATKGAVIGDNLYMPNGSIATAESLAAYFGITNAPETTNAHRLLSGLGLGNDHPQYILKATLTSQGDILVRDTVGVTRLGLGITGQVMTAANGMPSWQDLPIHVIRGDDGQDGERSYIPGPEGPAGPAGPPGSGGGDVAYVPGRDGEDGERSYIPGPRGEPGAPGGGSGSATEIEVDFGSSPVYDAEFTVTDAAISPTSKVTVVESGNVAIGRVAGDARWDSIQVAALPGSGSAVIYCKANPGPVVGRRKLHYMVS